MARASVILLAYLIAHTGYTVDAGRKSRSAPVGQIPKNDIDSNIPANAFYASMDPAARETIQRNLDSAIKLYLMAKRKLSPLDMTATASMMSEVASKDAPKEKGKDQDDMEKAAGESRSCLVAEGCVTLHAKTKFLHNRFIPGNDNVYSPYFYAPGHLFHGTSSVHVVDDDFRCYIMSRPKNAVPASVRKLLMPEGDALWPGGDGSDRSPFLPKTPEAGAGQAFWELDLDPMDDIDPETMLTVAPDAGLVGTTEGEKDTEPLQRPSKPHEPMHMSELFTTDEIIDFTIWAFVATTLLIVPTALVTCMVRSNFQKKDDDLCRRGGPVDRADGTLRKKLSNRLVSLMV
mmetsp:Transcript_22646/g.43266  ORF Transcript_22646/g.43266 Transcript_22646/m.43266 type:complete len:346 (+) Transcript_22646:80-1117(+)|eukprot:CAMPEP_0114233184 /NCGR_PEP_ID=MMETSP0058-20121206/5020_1 /TAXON_ID=36894 /ORGANISM="Pyramimonas parkeae, CCMP726" /LENGTH=345 /DNA_ID=CAMNT_0001344739 /DNA_START=48 /DNA_END=1085 /DNA_ORIENTATION=+